MPANSSRLIFYAGAPPHLSTPPLYYTTTSGASQAFQMLNFCYGIVTKVLRNCYESRTNPLQKCYGTDNTAPPYPIRRPRAGKQAASWKLVTEKLEAGSCPEKSAEQLQAGNFIHTEAAKNYNHRFSACCELRYSAHLLEHKDPPQAGNPSE